jgi:O-antigen/teichoic acid export membrane protein
MHPERGVEDAVRTAHHPRLRGTVLRAVLWLGTGTVVGQVVSWLSTIVVIRLLSPTDYGLMAMTAVFTALLTHMSEMGIGSALVQTKELTERATRQIFAWVLLTAASGLTLSFALAPAIAAFYGEPQLVLLVRVLSLNLILMSLYVVPQAMFIRQMDFRVRATVNLWAQIISALVTVAFALRGMGVWSLVAGSLAVHAVTAIIFNVRHGRWTTPLFDFNGSARLVKFGGTLTAGRFLSFLYVEADKIIVGRFLGDAMLGIYSVAVTLAAKPLDRLVPIFTQVSFASYSRIQDEPERVRTHVLTTIRAVALVAFPAFFGMSAVAPMAVPLLLGSKWEPSVLPFQLICLILPLRALAALLPPVALAVGRPGVNLANAAVLASVMPAALLLGVQRGILGVCLVWVAVYPLVFLFTSARTLAVIGIPVGRFWDELRFPIMAAFTMLAAIWMLRSLITVAPVYSFIAAVLVGATLYASLLLVFKRKESAELRALFGW